MRLRPMLVLALGLVCGCFLPQVARAQSEAAKMGPPKPEAWWPVQPRPLPLVHPLFSDDMVLQREIAASARAGDLASAALADRAGRQLHPAQLRAGG